MQIVFTCHVETDLKNEKGYSSELPVEEQTFNHITLLSSFLKKLDIPITLAFMVGGICGDRLLEYIVREGIEWPNGSEIAIHYHLVNSQPPSFVDQTTLFNFIQKDLVMNIITRCHHSFVKLLNVKPWSSVLGHWLVHPDIISKIKELGVIVDGSYAPYHTGQRFVVKQPFLINGLIEVPVLSDGLQPLNITTWRAYYVLRWIIKSFYHQNLLVHAFFHSYDLFNFTKCKFSLKREAILLFKKLHELERHKPIILGTLQETKIKPQGSTIRSLPKSQSTLFSTIGTLESRLRFPPMKPNLKRFVDNLRNCFC